VLCVRVLAPTEGLGGATLVGGVLQMVSEPTLAVARTGQCADVTPEFLAPNKSPNKSCVFSKLSR
jgi:hypothetical protein